MTSYMITTAIPKGETTPDLFFLAIEEGKEGRRLAAQAKTAIAELAESVTGRIRRVMGGGTFSRSSPFGYWHEDGRALGILRPPWGLVYDNLFEWSCAAFEE